jgi:hypothetical protein
METRTNKTYSMNQIEGGNPMAKQIATVKDATEADALEIALMKWRIGACADSDTPAEVLAQIKQRGGINPRYAKFAALWFHLDDLDDWWSLYVALKCGGAVDERTAHKIFDDAIGLGWGTSRLKEAIKESKPPRAKRKDAAGDSSQRFETWAKEKELDLTPNRNTTVFPEISYGSIETEMFWECWRAAVKAGGSDGA